MPDPIVPPHINPDAVLDDSTLMAILRVCMTYGEDFWEYIKSRYPEYYELMSWYGNKDAVYSRIWEMYKRGRNP